jgi:hypothetical protein
MSEKTINTPLGHTKDSTPNETLRRAEAASGIGAFEFDLVSKRWVWTPQVAVLFGLDPQTAPSQFSEWLSTVFPDDALKIRSALEGANSSGSFYVEFRVKGHDGRLHWLAGKGQVDPDTDTGARVLRGTYYDINERKQLEARLLSVNETLEARVAELREEAHTLDVLNRTGIAIGAELDLERLVQRHPRGRDEVDHLVGVGAREWGPALRDDWRRRQWRTRGATADADHARHGSFVHRGP